MTVWMYGQDAASLTRTPPEELYFRLKAARKQQEREEQERAAAVELKLDEFFNWALRRWEESSIRFRRVGRDYLMTEHPLRQQTQDALTVAVLDWAFTHTQDPDFLSKSPNEVAVYLLMRNSVLLTAIELGQQAPPHLDYVPVPDETAATADDLAIELLVGVVPVVGEAADLRSLLTGQSVTGRKLRREEEFLAALGVLLPFVARLRRGERMVEGDVEVLRRIAQKLERPLSEAASTLRQVARCLFSECARARRGCGWCPASPRTWRSVGWTTSSVTRASTRASPTRRTRSGSGCTNLSSATKERARPSKGTY